MEHILMKEIGKIDRREHIKKREKEER